MIAELLAKIGVDISDLHKAEIALKSFEHNFQQAFRRPPAGEMRQEAALSGALRQVVAGDVPGAIESILHRIGLIPAAVGVGFGAIILGATKAIEASKELDAQFESMNANLSKTPTAAQGIQALGTLIEDQSKKLGDSAGQHIMAGIGNRLRQLPQSLMDAILNKADTTEDRTKREQAEKAAIASLSIKQVSEALEQQGIAYQDIAELADDAAKGDAQAAANKKASLGYDKEMAALTEDRDKLEANLKDKLLDPNISEADKRRLTSAQEFAKSTRERAAQTNRGAIEGPAARTAALADEELIVAAQISEVKAKGLSADLEKNVLAQINIQHLAKQLEIQEGIVNAEDAAAAKLKSAQADVSGDEKRRGVKKFESIFDQSLYTVDELTKMKRSATIGGEMSIAQVNAREIQRLENRAQIEKAQGHPMDAFAALTRAQEIRAGMPLLKSSEKMPEFAFAAAIDSASVFKGMLQYLETIAGKVQTDNPFLNK